MEDSFTIGDWGSTIVEEFELDEETIKQLRELEAQYAEFCTKHNLQGVMATCVGQTSQNTKIFGTTHFSRALGRNVAELFAADYILKNSLHNSADYLCHIVSTDYKRNTKSQVKVH